MKKTSITAARNIDCAFYRESDEENDYLIESEKIRERTTPEGHKEYELLVRIVVKPKSPDWKSLEGQGLDKPLTKWEDKE